MARRLTAYLDHHRAGWFEMDDSGRVSFLVDSDWAAQADGLEVSLSLAKSRSRHDGGAPLNFLAGLLPDDPDVLTRWGRRFGVSPRSPVRLLEHVGLDTAGGLQLAVDDAPELAWTGGCLPVSEDSIGQHLAELRRDPSAWHMTQPRPQTFSLAGGQAKFALTDAHGGWALPYGSEPTTHIFKPGAEGFERQDIAEHLTMRAAHHVGLPVAESRLLDFGGQSVIVVTRFDRARTADGVRRVHQEDLVQATGIHPRSKYENEGGPGIAAIVALFRCWLRVRAADRAVETFLRANAFNWLVVAPDAHAKNYALLHTAQGPELAPLYDLSTALCYPDVADPWRVRLAMKVGGNYLCRKVLPRHWAREAEAAGLDPEGFLDSVHAMAGRLAEAFAQAARESGFTGEDARFAAALVDAVAERQADVLRLW